MSDCRKLDPLVTPYVDGELPPAERDKVDAHLRVCPPCHARVAVEQSVHDLLGERRTALRRSGASETLRTRCAGLSRAADAAPAVPMRPPRSAVRAPAGHARVGLSRLQPLALAASLVLLVGGAFLYLLTESSSRVMAAELVADHVKCFSVNRVLHTQQQASIVESALASTFGWQTRLPAHPQQVGLELIGARPCLYGEGRVAHLMYRHNGRPVSVFMLPGARRANELVEVMGHEAAIWSSGNRTFVLVAREPRDEVEQIASFVHETLR